MFCKLSMANSVFDEQVQIFVSGPVLYLLHLAQSSRRPRILQHYALTFSKFSEPSLASCEDCELAERGKLYDPLTYIAQMKEVQIAKHKYKYKLYDPLSNCGEQRYRIRRNVKAKILLCSVH